MLSFSCQARKEGRTNDMKEHGTKRAAGTQIIEPPGGGYTLKRDDKTQMGVNAHAAQPSVNSHAALPSRFERAGGSFDRPDETCSSSRARWGPSSRARWGPSSRARRAVPDEAR